MRLRWLLIVMCVAMSMIPIGIIAGFQGFDSTIVLLVGLLLLVMFCASLVISYFITRPLEKLTRNIDRISKGDLNVELETSEIYEINDLVQSLNRVMASLKLAIHKYEVKHGEIFEGSLRTVQNSPKSSPQPQYAAPTPSLAVPPRDEQPLENTIKLQTQPIDSHKKKLIHESLAHKPLQTETDLDALLLFDEHTKIVDCTTAIVDLLGYSKKELLGLTLVDVDALETQESIRMKLRDAKKHGSIMVKTVHKRKDGSSVLVKEQIDYLKDKNLFQCVVTPEAR